ncbi:histidine phosphatase family protein [Anaerocolumna xylanovorans]|uniref:Probable phosphoglycerate mutase n=1 Tax=Anaerocolumna xylanovorans DSM 12503 TaxID=1121345 RepID=A0A1M7YGS0_9FIRM|nr:histidine phosphatase family protein [Anaerocolumna xylanovorans]SHO51786.1 probable phosphoglycerate mutase [Anaerocolumna xylanovorans DSM 12503]
MSTEILLIRHGETIWNKLGKFQGSTDIELSEEGRKQALALKASLKPDFQAIYASPLIRATETANILCEGTGLKVMPCKEMREINFGAWEGLTFDEIKNSYPEEFALWRNDEKDCPLMGGDLSIRNASNRAAAAILSIAADHAGQKVLLVAHGAIIKAGLIGLFEWKMTMYHHFYVGNTAITKLSFRSPDDPVLESFNDTSHLKQERTLIV